MGGVLYGTDFLLTRSTNLPRRQSLIHSKCRQGCRRVEVQFFHEIGPVFFHGFWTDTQVVSNFFVPVSLTDQLEYLTLTLGQKPQR